MTKLKKIIPALMCMLLIFPLASVPAYALDVNAGEIVASNDAVIDINNGTVNINNGAVDTNNGTVTTNNGTIVFNEGVVAGNSAGAAVVLNYSGGVIVNEGGRVGTLAVVGELGYSGHNYGTVYNASGLGSVDNDGSNYRVFSLVTVNNGTAADAGSGTLVTNGISGDTRQWALTDAGAKVSGTAGTLTFTAASSGSTTDVLTASIGTLSYDPATGIYTLTGVDGCVILTFTSTGGYCAAVISFNGGGAAGEMHDAALMPGTEYTLPECEYEAPAGRSLLGWSRTGGSESGELYQPGDTLIFGTAECLTAVWG